MHCSHTLFLCKDERCVWITTFEFTPKAMALDSKAPPNLSIPTVSAYVNVSKKKDRVVCLLLTMGPGAIPISKIK
jgi:hypothetical protein